MKNTVSISQAQRDLPGVIRRAEQGYTLAVTRHDETVAYILPRERLEALIETMELLANPHAMQAIHAAESGTTVWHSLDELDKDNAD